MPENISRRSLLSGLGSLGFVLLASSCSSKQEAEGYDASTGGSSGDASAVTGEGGSSSTGGAAPAAGGSSGNATCQVTPEETAGPYPDKIGMLGDSKYFRSDITEGRTGVPLTLTLTISNTNGGCAPLANANIEIWHCDADGNYSEYTQPGYDGTGETFLRGVQTTDANGEVTFKTIYPGWYQGRVTHIHFQVYVSGKPIKTSQIAFDESITSTVYDTSDYVSHGQSPMTNAQDMVFSDGDEYELAELTGDTSKGYAATLAVGVAV
jgi:protocatechuate 3,4-dioxygenase beta subunit